MKTSLILFFGLVVFFCSFYRLGAQGHYWSENYGNRSMLLSGTVNANVEDLGAVYYNPGRLGLIENPAFVISAQVYEWRILNIEDGVEEGVDLNTSNFGGVPSLVSGTFSLPFLEDHKFAYSFLTRQRSDSDLFFQVEEDGRIVEDIPGEVYFSGKLGLKRKFREEWIGLTWSPPVTKNFGIGLSNFVSIVNKSNELSLDMNTLDEQNMVTSLEIGSSYRYNSIGLIWKLGLAWELSKVRIGMTITTPRLNITGNGSTNYEEYLTGIDTTGNGINDDVFIVDFQRNLKSKYRTPWAVGLGIGIPLKRGIIHVSAEWFNQVSRYVILESEPFIGQSSQEVLQFAVVDELNPVLNYGIGLEMYLNEKVSFYASIATDNSAVPSEVSYFASNEEEVNNSIFKRDFVKLGGGIMLATKWADVTLGATFAEASQDIDRPISFNGDDPIFDSEDQATIKYSKWQFIVGFSIPFADRFLTNGSGAAPE